MWMWTSLFGTQLKCLGRHVLLPPILSSVSCQQVMCGLQVCSPCTHPFCSIMQITVITITKCVIVRQCSSRDISWDIHETSCPWHKSLTSPSKRFIWDIHEMNHSRHRSFKPRPPRGNTVVTTIHRYFLLSVHNIYNEVAMVTIQEDLPAVISGIETSKQHLQKFNSTDDSR